MTRRGQGRTISYRALMRSLQIAVPKRSLREIFDRHEGRLIHKVDHYFPIYERHLEHFRGTSPTVLEIGVAQGGSVEMWHEYFGRGTVTVGLDIDPRSATLAGRRRHVVIGDQSDPDVLLRIAEEFGPFDMILDDGSHRAEHQITLIETLWDHLTDDGVLLVEDLHTDYWPEYGGGHLRPDTFIERVKPLLDDINAFNSKESDFTPTHWTETLTGIGVYDSVVVLERGSHKPFTTSMAGRPSFDTVNGLPWSEALTDEHRARMDEMNTPARRIRRAVLHPRLVLDTVRQRLRRSK